MHLKILRNGNKISFGKEFSTSCSNAPYHLSRKYRAAGSRHLGSVDGRFLGSKTLDPEALMVSFLSGEDKSLRNSNK
jgi:hypothetical protein